MVTARAITPETLEAFDSWWASRNLGTEYRGKEVSLWWEKHGVSVQLDCGHADCEVNFLHNLVQLVSNVTGVCGAWKVEVRECRAKRRS